LLAGSAEPTSEAGDSRKQGEAHVRVGEEYRLKKIFRIEIQEES